MINNRYIKIFVKVYFLNIIYNLDNLDNLDNFELSEIR